MRRLLSTLALALLLPAAAQAADLRATGDMGIVIERAAGSVAIIDGGDRARVATVEGLGDLSHASAVFSPDERYAYVFGRDGGLSKVDILTGTLVNRVMQSGNSIGGAISADGRLVAVANYDPGGVRVFDADTLAPVADIPATAIGDGKRSKVVGLADAPGNRFVFALWDTGEIWIADFSQGTTPELTKITDIGANPYDALITPDGRYYIAGLFGEDGLALVDLWHPKAGVRRILDHYGKGAQQLPVYKMPHLEGWAVAGNRAFVPAVGHHEVLVIDMDTWTEAGRIAVHGQPVFVMGEPGGRRVWVNFAVPDNDTVQVIDTESLSLIDTITPGPGVLHMEFAPRGTAVWMSVRDGNEVQLRDTTTRAVLATLPADKPSGIFLTARAHRIGL